MKVNKRDYIIVLTFLFFILLFYFFQGQYKKYEETSSGPITINLLTSVHPDLAWHFKPLNPKLFAKPGEVITVEYIVENLGNKKSTGIATFQYFPKQYETYISKINCFCYDAQTLKANEKAKYVLVMLIDPEATKDNKTKNIKEITIQFTFFDYKKYKEMGN